MNGTEEHPTLEAIRQGIKNRLLDIEDEERELRIERATLEKAQAALSPENRPKRPRLRAA